MPEQIRPWVPGTYVTLGTDGFGFSDTRPAARRYFNTDAESVVVAVLEGLARDGEIDPSVAVEAAKQVPDRRRAGRARADLRPRASPEPRPGWRNPARTSGVAFRDARQSVRRRRSPRSKCWRPCPSRCCAG